MFTTGEDVSHKRAKDSMQGCAEKLQRNARLMLSVCTKSDHLALYGFEEFHCSLHISRHATSEAMMSKI